MDVGEQQHEFVAAESRHHVAAANAVLEPLGDAAQQLVAHIVAERVVNDFHAVQIQKQNAEHRVFFFGVGERAAQFVAEQSAVRQIGQRIVIRHMTDGFLRAFVFADVGEHAADNGRRCSGRS